MSAAPGEVLVDAHVHVHAGLSTAALLDAAVDNLRAGGRDLGIDKPAGLALLLTESAGDDAFANLVRQAEAEADSESSTPASVATSGSTRVGNGWGFRATAERDSLWALRDVRTGRTERDAPADRLLLIAGRQLVTRERLEVLALGCRDALPDGMALRHARDAVIDAGGVPVVPWGFGKWWGARGRLLAELIRADSPGRWYLGDNAGRLHLSRRPKLFTLGAHHGVFVLPGSDPLPIAGQESKAGRCGFAMNAALDADRPAAMLRDWLRACRHQPDTFGRYEGIAGFVRDQLAMQVRKRRGGTGGVAR